MTEILPKTSLEKSENPGNSAEKPFAEEHKMTQKEIDDKRKTAEQLEPLNFGIRTVQGALNFLLKEGQAGRNVFMQLYSKKIYSFGVKTEDDIYLQYYGMTKFEYEVQHEKEVARITQKEKAQKEKEHLERLDRASNLIEEGKKYIKTEYIGEWEQMINKINVDDRDGQYDLLAIDDALKIIKLIEIDFSYEDIQKWFDNQRRTDHYGTIIKYVIHFSKDSKDFDKKIRKTTIRKV